MQYAVVQLDWSGVVQPRWLVLDPPSQSRLAGAFKIGRSSWLEYIPRPHIQVFLLRNELEGVLVFPGVAVQYPRESVGVKG